MLRNTTNANVSGNDRSNIAGLFNNCTSAEQAIADLKVAGFAENQIGVARAEEESVRSTTSMTSGAQIAEQHHERGMWDKVKSAFTGQKEDDTRDRNAIREDNTTTTGSAYPDENYAYGEDMPQHLSSAGLSESESRYFSSRLRHGGCLVNVNTAGGRTTEAIAILERNGADIGSSASTFRTQGEEIESDMSNKGEQRIQLLGEMLRVHKDRVASGEVRMRKEVVTENRTLQVPVTREELVIERTNVSGDAPAGASIGDNPEIRVPLSEEQIRVHKQSVVTGEVRVGKRQVTETRNISDTVRHEEIKVEKEGDVSMDESSLDHLRKKRA